MADTGRIGKQSLTVFGILLISSNTRCQYPAQHPVSFTQASSNWPNPHVQQSNPPWHQFSAPRKRSPEYVSAPYVNQPSLGAQYSHQPSMSVQYMNQPSEGAQYSHQPSMSVQYMNQPVSYNTGPFGSQTLQNLQEYPQNYDGRSSFDYMPSETQLSSDGRLLSDSAFTKISETLGAINTVGHYLVDMVNDEDEDDENNPNLKRLPQAFYTISKNVLGRNVTDKIAPIVKKALPKVLPDAPITKIATSEIDRNDERVCTTPDGQEGVCEDLRNCPQLLLNLIALRESLCFKDLFVPGVCCPRDAIVTTTSPIERPIVATTQKPTYLVPITTQKPKPATTKRPSAVLVLTTKKPKPVPSPATTRKPTTVTTAVTTPRPAPTTPRPIRTTTFYTVAPPVIANYSNIVDPDECGQKEDEGGRIVGGTESKPGAWPWMAAIYLHGSKRREFWCGGTLVNKRHVLTAAHCTRDSKQRPFPPRQFTVRLGDVDLARDDEPSWPVTLRVTAVRAHEQFSRVGFYNDIAVLVLAENVQKSKYVIPICLPQGEQLQRTFERSLATVVGWGTTRYGGAESSKQLEAKLPVWRNEDCDKSYFQPITDTFLCAGYARGGVDACQGDSGGPLMLQIDGRWTQIGVVSFGNKCGEPGYPGVYTRVTRYNHWLDQNLLN